MVDRSPDRLDTVFQALSDRTRRGMLQRLAQREHCVGELAEPFDMSLAAASKHIQVLERAGLVRRTVQGRRHRVRIDAHPLHAGAEWLRHYERFWNARLDALAALLEADATTAPPKRTGRKPRR
ncbi:ArsR/SmtB family transcription factor [Luteimonas salinilitoris]|uniref:ArsR/SmtB family transcription factor n=1 Tax=Luteimonas salinilitoris TaxID=3237697 RepID=A0ABV4HLL4_9GAMM